MFQTRSECNGVRHEASLEAALEAAKADKTIWKISFGVPTGERIRLVRREDSWVLERIEDIINTERERWFPKRNRSGFTNNKDHPYCICDHQQDHHPLLDACTKCDCKSYSDEASTEAKDPQGY